MIDGELVYKVNKSTIKKVNVTYGPTIKASSLLTNQSAEDRPVTNVNQSEQNGEPDLNCFMLNETETSKEPADKQLNDADREPVKNQSGHHGEESKGTNGSDVLEV